MMSGLQPRLRVRKCASFATLDREIALSTIISRRNEDTTADLKLDIGAFIGLELHQVEFDCGRVSREIPTRIAEFLPGVLQCAT